MITAMIQTMQIWSTVNDIHIEMISGLNMVATTKSSNWWYDSAAIIYVCNQMSLFKTYVNIEKTKEVMMGNANFTKSIGNGSCGTPIYF